MSELRQLVKEKLDMAAEDIFKLFERTTAHYEAELGYLKQQLDDVQVHTPGLYIFNIIIFIYGL